MSDFFSNEMRRNPFPVYDELRRHSSIFKVPPPFDAWMILDYEGVKRVLNDHETFSSGVPAPRNWFLFSDPPQHSKMRALVSRAFTPRIVSDLEPRIRALSGRLLDAAMDRGEIDLAAEYSTPLAMTVIAEMLGIPSAEWLRFKHWSDVIMRISYTRSGGEEAKQAGLGFQAVTAEMNDYLTEMIALRRETAQDDLLTRLLQAEVDGQGLTQEEILGFFQLLMVGGQETSANLINNAILCLIENPEQLLRLQAAPELLPSTIEEVLRYRSPIQWMMRTPKREIEMHGQLLKPGQLVLPMIGCANRDPKLFASASQFDIAREPNPHISFGHGIHSCIGAALARLEAKIAVSDILQRLKNFTLASKEPWEPRQALQVHGPSHLRIRFDSGDTILQK